MMNLYLEIGGDRRTGRRQLGGAKRGQEVGVEQNISCRASLQRAPSRCIGSTYLLRKYTGTQAGHMREDGGTQTTETTQ